LATACLLFLAKGATLSVAMLVAALSAQPLEMYSRNSLLWGVRDLVAPLSGFSS
jgi:hypothetical protein